MTIQLISATILMTASLSLVARPANRVTAMSACGLVWLEPARLVTDCLRHRCEWSRLDAELWAQPAPPGHGDMAV